MAKRKDEGILVPVEVNFKDLKGYLFNPVNTDAGEEFVYMVQTISVKARVKDILAGMHGEERRQTRNRIYNSLKANALKIAFERIAEGGFPFGEISGIGEKEFWADVCKEEFALEILNEIESQLLQEKHLQYLVEIFKKRKD